MAAVSGQGQQGQREFRFTVAGRPAPQGSKTPLPDGRMKESSRYLDAWREVIAWSAWEQLRALGYRQNTWAPIAEVALVLEVTFSLHRPARPKNARPIIPPDLDKLIRAVGDALTNSRVWKDDALVVTTVAHKHYALEGRSPVVPDQLTLPGAVVRVRRVDGQDVLPPPPAATRPGTFDQLFTTASSSTSTSGALS